MLYPSGLGLVILHYYTLMLFNWIQMAVELLNWLFVANQIRAGHQRSTIPETNDFHELVLLKNGSERQVIGERIWLIC